MDTLSYRKKGVESNELKTAEVLTPDGLQGVELIPAKIIFRWMIKDNPELSIFVLHDICYNIRVNI